MKKINLFFLLFAVTALVLGGCSSSKNDEPTVDPDKSPTISLSATGTGGATGGITTNQTYTVGTDVPNTLQFFVNASKNTAENNKLSSFEVTLSVNGATALMVSGYPEELTGNDRDGFTGKSIQLDAPTAAGTYTYNFRVIDRKNFLAVTSVTITIASPVNCNDVSNQVSLSLSESNGTITATPSGGTAPYLYSFDGGETYGATNTYLAPKNGSYSVIVVDANGCNTTQSISVNSLAVTEFAGITLGAQNNANPSCYNVKTNTRVSIVNYTTQKGSLDFVHFNGTTNLMTIASPSDADVATVFADYGISTSGANSVQFKKLTTTPYADADTDGEVSGAWSGSGVTAGSKANQLAANDEIAFRTSNGGSDLYGIIKVTAANAGTNNNGSITISVKRQQIGSEVGTPKR
ncbi:MAG: hypothetical protein KF690_08995 [Bacteroidetes bacterium]|nr:hypothetical protein [Bacteroidota bacterium]